MLPKIRLLYFFKVQTSVVILTTVISLKVASPLKIHKLLYSVTNCDLAVFHGGLESQNFLPSDFHLPTIIFYVGKYSKSRRSLNKYDFINFVLDFSNARVSPCQLSLFVAQEMSDLKQLSQWIPAGAERRVTFGRDQAQVITSTRNVFLVLVTRSELRAEFSKIRVEKTFDLETVENFGIVFYHPSDNTVELCVQADGELGEVSEMKCNYFTSRQNLLETFKSLKTIKRKWELQLYADKSLDIKLPFWVKGSLRVELVLKNENIPVIVNPFDRSAINVSLHLHLLQNVFLRINASLSYCENCKRVEDRVYLTKLDDENDSDAVLTYVPAGFTGYQFITCHSEKEMSFMFYITPFQGKTGLYTLKYNVPFGKVNALKFE